MFAETSSGESTGLSLLQLLGVAFTWFWGPFALGRQPMQEAIPDAPDDAVPLLRILAVVLSAMGVLWLVSGVAGLLA